MNIDQYQEIKLLIKNINWYISRKKSYEEENFEKHVEKRGHEFDKIKNLVGGVKFDTIGKLLIEFYKYLDTKKQELDASEKAFLNQFSDIESLYDIEEFNEYKQKFIEQSVPEQITKAFNNMHISNKITIDSLTGTEDDIDGWFESFEIKSNAANWSDEIRGLRLPAYLSDTAIIIWKTQVEANKYKYQESKNHIIRSFENENTLEQNFYSRKQKETESVLEYYCKLQHLASKVFKTTETDNMKKSLLRVFWAGLLPSIRRLVIGSTTPIELETALAIAKQTEKFVIEEEKTNKFITAASSQNSSNLSRKNREYSSEREKDYRAASYRNFDRDRVGRRNSSSDRDDRRSKSPLGDRRVNTPHSGKREPFKCYECGGIGHMARDCRNKFKCENCNRTGHTKDRCYARKSTNQLNY